MLILQVVEADLVNGGSRREIKLFGVSSAVAIAVDWIGSHVYVVDGGANKIDAFSLDGLHRKNIISSVSQPRDVALAADDGFVVQFESSSLFSHY